MAVLAKPDFFASDRYLWKGQKSDPYDFLWL